MKRFIAILFLSVLLFNLYGYQLVVAYLEQQNDTKLTAKIDKEDYTDADLISIKTALSLPYHNNSQEFERVDGAIEINGIACNYVKRRVYNDTLEVLCLPNTVKQKLQNAKSDFFKIANDLQRPEGSKKQASIIKNVLPEYCEALTFYKLQLFYAAKQKFPVLLTPCIPFQHTPVQEQPPETMPFLS